MSTLAIILQTGGALAGVVLLITLLRVPPVMALFAGALYLGIATGQGLGGTVETITTGFGDVMAEVGLLIAFGVLIGAFLAETGVLRRLVDLLIRTVHPRGVPYALSTSLTALFPAIFTDAMLVLTAPLVRGLADRGGGRLPVLASSVVVGLEFGLMMVVPGAGIMAIGGVLGVPLGMLFLWGLAVAVPGAALTVAAYRLLFRFGIWRPARDEDQVVPPEPAQQVVVEDTGRSAGPLWFALSPLLLALLLVAGGAAAEAAGLDHPVIGFLGSPTVALFVGLVGAYALARRMRGAARCGEVLEAGIGQAGLILVLTGVGGALAAVVSGTGLAKLLSGLVGSGATTSVLPLLLAWFAAAVLRTATGSPIAGAVAVAGVLGPLAGSLGVAPVFVALAAGAGGVFGLHVNSNFFWMFQSLMRVTTTGTLRSCTLVTSLGSVVCLPLIVAYSLIA